MTQKKETNLDSSPAAGHVQPSPGPETERVHYRVMLPWGVCDGGYWAREFSMNSADPVSVEHFVPLGDRELSIWYVMLQWMSRSYRFARTMLKSAIPQIPRTTQTPHELPSAPGQHTSTTARQMLCDPLKYLRLQAS